MGYFISKALKGHEYAFSRQFAIACASKKQAEKLAKYLNDNDSTAIGVWKLKDNQTWYVYEPQYFEPLWKIRRRNGNIVVVPNTSKY